MEIHDYNLKMQEEMISEIEKNKPLFLLFVNIPFSWLSKPDSPKRIFEWYNKYATEHYNLVGLVDITQGLYDIRGYDSVDPKRLMDLLKIVRADVSSSPIYAQVQWFFPKMYINNNKELSLPPILNMLNVRYVIFCNRKITELPVLIQKGNYTIIENKGAMPRVYIPSKVEFIPDEKKILSRLASPEFNPYEVAFIEEQIDYQKKTIGSAKIIEETPSEIKIGFNMQTRGLLVLADLWDKGWKAEISGKEIPVLRTNYAIRGVTLPAGEGTVIFRYKPFSFYLGLLLMMIAIVIIIIWIILIKYYFPKKEIIICNSPPKFYNEH